MKQQTAQQFDQSLIDELFANLTQQAQPTPLQLPAPQSEPPRPYWAGRQKMLERQAIEEQISALVEASAVRVYEMLRQRLDEMKAQQNQPEEIEIRFSGWERRKWLNDRAARETTSSPCTPSRQDWYR